MLNRTGTELGTCIIVNTWLNLSFFHTSTVWWTRLACLRDTENLPDCQVTVCVQTRVQGAELRLRESVVCPDFVTVVARDNRVAFGAWQPCRCRWSAAAACSCACGGSDCCAAGNRNRNRAGRGIRNTLGAVVFPGDDETVRPNAGVQRHQLSLRDGEGVGDEVAGVAWLDEVPPEAVRGCAARGWARWRNKGLDWWRAACFLGVSYAVGRWLLL